MSSGNRLRLAVATPATAYNDGASGAIYGTIPYPTLLGLTTGTNLNGIAFAIRPPWQVAGVDYPVGYDAGIVLKDVLTAPLPAGATLNTTSKYVAISGSVDVVLDGYDFTAAGVGYGIYIGTFTGSLTVKNCKFKVGTANIGPIQFSYGLTADGAGLTTVKNCEFDGSGTAGFAIVNARRLVLVGRESLIEYNYFKNINEDGIRANPKAGILSLVVRYNLFDGGGYDTAAHTDMVQVVNGDGASGLPAAADVPPTYVYGNTVYQKEADPSGFPGNLNCLYRVGDLGGKTAFNPTVHHNVIVGIGNTGHMGPANSTAYPALHNAVQFATSNTPFGLIDGATVYQNYVYTSPGGSFNTGTKQGFDGGPFYPTTGLNQYTINNNYGPNYQMRDGTLLTTTP